MLPTKTKFNEFYVFARTSSAFDDTSFRYNNVMSARMIKARAQKAESSWKGVLVQLSGDEKGRNLLRKS